MSSKIIFERNTQFDRVYWDNKDNKSIINDNNDIKILLNDIQKLEEYNNEYNNIRNGMSKRIRKDNISSLFTIFKDNNNTTTYNTYYYNKNIIQDKEYFLKKNSYTEYNEDTVKYKHTMR